MTYLTLSLKRSDLKHLSFTFLKSAAHFLTNVWKHSCNLDEFQAHSPPRPQQEIYYLVICLVLNWGHSSVNHFLMIISMRLRPLELYDNPTTTYTYPGWKAREAYLIAEVKLCCQTALIKMETGKKSAIFFFQYLFWKTHLKLIKVCSSKEITTYFLQKEL